MRRRVMPGMALVAQDMAQPVRCRHCSTVYDLATVTLVGAHWRDCTAWRCPGCNLLVDDRGETGGIGGGAWRKDYDRLDKAELVRGFNLGRWEE